MSETHKFKIVLLGEGRVGKTSLLLRYIEGKFSEQQTSTFQAHYKEKRIHIGGASVSLSIWDTAGQERFHALAPIYYRDSNGAILVYDITDKTSFIKVQHWVEELRKIVGYDIILFMAANKIDLEHKRQVNKSDAMQYGLKVGAKIFDTSAKSGTGVEQLFLELTKSLLKQARNKQKGGNNKRKTGPRMKIDMDMDDTKNNKKDGGCCNII
mmetsp:Transcript_85589/g.105046  ORF Transcript_85589/g.105046 Transcript_85589/m.105046 type:complete len:211 (+) Transcript_85589:50-682(+)